MQTTDQISGVACESLKVLLENRLPVEQFRNATMKDDFYGVILRYIEMGHVEPDLTTQMKNLFKVASHKFVKHKGLL